MDSQGGGYVCFLSSADKHKKIYIADDIDVVFSIFTFYTAEFNTLMWHTGSLDVSNGGPHLYTMSGTFCLWNLENQRVLKDSKLT